MTPGTWPPGWAGWRRSDGPRSLAEARCGCQRWSLAPAAGDAGDAHLAHDIASGRRREAVLGWPSPICMPWLSWQRYAWLPTAGSRLPLPPASSAGLTLPVPGPSQASTAVSSPARHRCARRWPLLPVPQRWRPGWCIRPGVVAASAGSYLTGRAPWPGRTGCARRQRHSVTGLTPCI